MATPAPAVVTPVAAPVTAVAAPIPMATIPKSSDWGFMSEWWFIALVIVAIIVLIYYMMPEKFGAWNKDLFVSQYGMYRT